jgi:hypothetical protein
MGGKDNEHAESYQTGESPPFLRVLVHLFSWGKVALVRTFWPISGGIIIERHYVDESGNPELNRTATWVGFPPSGVASLGTGNTGESQV